MTSHWTSDVVMFKDGDGQACVSTAIQPGTVIDASKVRVYGVSGPYPLLGYHTEYTRVGDVATWMASLTAKGFTFEPATAG